MCQTVDMIDVPVEDGCHRGGRRGGKQLIVQTFRRVDAAIVDIHVINMLQKRPRKWNDLFGK